MDAQQFLAEFRHIANAQGGIAHLRTMIYQLAVTGSLTPRGDTAEDAGQLLANISEKRQKLIHAKQYKRMLELESEPVLPPQSIALPATWRWTRLLDIGEINPRNDAPDNQLAAFVPMSGVPQHHRAGIVAETKRWGDIKKGYTHFANDDVVLAKITPCFENGKSAVVEGLPGDAGIGAGTTELHVFRPIHTGILPAYVYLFLRSPLFTVEGEQSMTGTAGQRRLPTDYFATRAFPLPPSEEQGRIVAKVDELMALCDQLEQQQQDRRKLQNALRLSTLQALGRAQSARDLQTVWQRVQSNFGNYFSEKSDIDDLRKSVLALAFSGNLGFSAEPIQTSALSSILMEVSVNGVSKGPARSASGTEVLKISAGTSRKDFYVNEGDFKHVALSDEEVAKFRLMPGDLLACRYNGNLHYVGRFSYYRGESGRTQVNPDKLIRFRVAPQHDARYVCLMMNALPSRERIEAMCVTTAGNIGISAAKLGSIEIPLPSLSRQQEIVVRITTLMGIFSDIEKKLIDANRLAELLAGASVAALMGIAIEQNENVIMKIPQTQLIAPLRLGKAPNAKTEAPLARELVRHNGEMSANDLWQRFGGEIDAFYAQLKYEVAQGWIREPEPADVQVIEA